MLRKKSAGNGFAAGHPPPRGRFLGKKGKKMYAIIQTGGKQYKVQSGDIIEVEKLGAEKESEVVFDQVLAVAGDDGKLNVGTPLVSGAKVTAKVLDEFRSKKIVVFKMKRRKGYRRTQGHRQTLTRVEIGAIQG